MSKELAYVIITPYSLYKSRTGGIISRLISRSSLELVGARMFAPSEQLIKEYAEMTISNDDPQDRPIQELIYDYIVRELSPDRQTGRRRRVMVLLFAGEDAVLRIRQVVGNFRLGQYGGQTIRDTYGDLIYKNGQVTYFEPAVLAAPTRKEAEAKLKIWARYSDTDGGLLEGVIKYPEGQKPERTLVLIKPDNFQFPTGRPGNMVDSFSRTGLYIVAINVLHMSPAQAMEFYAPVKQALHNRLKDVAAAKAKEVLEEHLGLKIPAEQQRQLADVLGPLYAEDQFATMMKFMSGYRPDECTAQQRTQPGTEKCIALVYEGIDAIRKIREALGPTDPSKAPPGSVRREFGHDIMVNAAHASDSAESAAREMQIVRIADNTFKQIVEEYYGPVQ